MKLKEMMERNKKPEIILGDSIKIEGFVEIINGDTHIKAKNKFVQTMLQHLMNFLSGSTIVFGFVSGPTRADLIKMFIGTDTTTVTLFNTSALTAPIGGAPGTAPNTITGSVTNPSNGVFNMLVTATWNAGTVAGTVGEMALYLVVYPAPANLLAFKWSQVGYNPGAAVLASRLAVADGAFGAFLINAANPLVINWTIQLSF